MAISYPRCWGVPGLGTPGSPGRAVPGGRQCPIHLHPWGPARKEEGDTHTGIWRSPQGAEHTQVHPLKKKIRTLQTAGCKTSLCSQKPPQNPESFSLAEGLLGEDQAAARLCDLE